MNIRCLSACLAVLFCVSSLRAEAFCPEDICELRFAALWPDTSAKQTPHPSVVRVVATDRDGFSLGSGTLVDVSEEYGLVVTNWHVVRDAVGAIEVVFPDGFHSPARVVRTDREWDLAALLIWKPQAQPVPISSEAPRPGEKLTIAGYGSGNYKMQSGPCTQYLSPAPGKPPEIVELGAAARHGDSGGPILNSRGELAGVLFGEGGGRTDGSYGGRVRQFLQLTANDLQNLPTNVAQSPRSDGARGQSSDVGNSRIAQRRRPAASFDGEIAAADQESKMSTWQADELTASSSGAVGESTSGNRISRPLAIGARTEAATTAHHSAGESIGNPVLFRRIWLTWGGEVQSFLAAFGVAAILLQFLRIGQSKR